MATRIRSVDFLPEIFRTETNKQFLNATLDQMIQEPQLKRIQGYIGRRFGSDIDDGYVVETTKNRTNYQFEPTVIFRDVDNNNIVNDAITYPGILDAIVGKNGIATKQDRLWNSEFYTWDPFIDLDKFTNFGEYYWLPNGPDPVDVSTTAVPMTDSFDVTREDNGFEFSGVANVNPPIVLARGGNYTFDVTDPGREFWIQSAPGVNGKLPIADNISSRDVLGVINNGEDSGTITFNVPLKDAQSFYYNLNDLGPVDLATNMKFNEINNIYVDQLADGVDGLRDLNNRTLIFLNRELDAQDGGWQTTTFYDDTDNPYDTIEFDQTSDEPIPANRYSIWQIQYVYDNDGRAWIKLVQSQSTANLDKVRIEFGSDYSTTSFYLNADGYWEQIPLLTAIQDTLYYQDSQDPNLFGEIRLIDQNNVATLNISDILGQQQYISPNGVTFTNGLKVQFRGETNPPAYQDQTYYVEGVGSSIVLLATQNFVTPETYTKNVSDPYDSIGYDIGGWDESLNAPLDTDYIIINRADLSQNAWARGNRWFHSAVITATAEYNNGVAVFDQDYRAKRSIIEFKPNLKLYNSGTAGATAIDTIDFRSTDALSLINNQLGYSIDGYSLVQGSRVIFAADTDIDVRSKIYQVDFIDPIGNGTLVINLVPATDGQMSDNNQVVVKSGVNLQGATYYFDGSQWILAQQKTAINQFPKFDIFDNNNNSLSNRNIYPSSTFEGTYLFNYKVGTGAPDKVLEFPLTYLNIENVGDIVFDNYLYNDTFLYVNNGESVTEQISIGHVRQYTSRTSYNKLLGWEKSITDLTSRQIIDTTYTGTAIEIDVVPTVDTVIPNIKVYANGVFVTPDRYTIITNTAGVSSTINFITAPAVNSQIEIRLISDSISDQGFYSVPTNLEKNALNENSDIFTLGSIRRHYQSICENLFDLVGSINGSNNSRDLGDTLPYGEEIVQQSSPVVIPGALLRDERLDVVNSIAYSAREYDKFKNLLMDSVANTDTYEMIVSNILDDAIKNININKNNSGAFYWSDCLPGTGDWAEFTSTITPISDKRYTLSHVYDFSSANYRSILVWKNDVILTKDVDYTVDTQSPLLTVTVDTVIGDVIRVREYHNTFGTYCPATPTKLGLYPKYQPQKFVDNTYLTPIEVIQGHDGSITIAFGDVRDDVLLEFETRIYNNIKVQSAVPLDSSDVIPGQFRTTDYTAAEVNEILSIDFLTWVGYNRVDYRTQNYQSSNEYTWNYSQSGSKLDNKPLLGNWRGIYKYYYDTDRPHTHPWEMLGFTEMPSWWAFEYGPTPYTSGNLNLWGDLEAGIVKDPAGEYVLDQYRRPGLSRVIPVDSEGNLLSPFESIVKDYDVYSFRKSWVFGDSGPTESAWRKSSNWAFAVMRLLYLTRPAKFSAVNIDRDLYRYNQEFDQYLYNNRYRLDFNTLILYGSGTSKHSYLNWVVDYNKQYGIDTSDVVVGLLKNVGVQLAWRTAGYTDKNYLKLLIEKSSPGSTNSSLMVPRESFDIKLYRNQPFDQVVFSSVIVQRTQDGWSVSGYSIDRPYFEIATSTPNGNYTTFSVTVNGEIVNYQLLKDFSTAITRVPYGYVFTNREGVVDFLNSYGHLLEVRGMVFSDIQNNYTLDWGRMAQEFVNWTYQGFAVGSVINLNPCSDKLIFRKDQAVADQINNPLKKTQILNQDRKIINNSDLVIDRIDNELTIRNVGNDTINYVAIDFTSYEQILLVNNSTVFNDLVYDPIQGIRQNRMLINGWITIDWTGALDAQGFILNQDNVGTWKPNQKYTRGQYVFYKDSYWSAAEVIEPSELFDFSKWIKSDYAKINKGLLPNLATKSDQLQTSYNKNIANLSTDADLLAFGIIGFRPRQYMKDINLDDVSQVNVYSSFLDSKGSRKAANLFSGVTFGKESADYQIYENWAIKRATFGATANRNYVEIALDQSLLDSNPSLVHIANPGETSAADQSILYTNVYKTSRPLTSANIFPLTTETITDVSLPTAGYVNIDDADVEVFDITNLDSLNINLESVVSGAIIWVAKSTAYDWNIYRATPLTGILTTVTDNLNGTSTIKFNAPHGLLANDIIVIRFFNQLVDSAYTVTSVTDLSRCVIQFQTTGTQQTEITGEGTVFKLESIRTAQPSNIASLSFAKNLRAGNRVWVDSRSGLWTVYEKIAPFSLDTVFKPVTLVTGQLYGTSLAQGANGAVAIVGAPGDASGDGSIYVYAQGSENTYTIVQTLTPTVTDLVGLGNAADIGTLNWAVVGAKDSDSGRGYALVTYWSPSTNVMDPWQWLLPDVGVGSSNEFGHSVTISTDERWIYVGEPGNDTVHVYGRVDIPDQVVKIVSDGFTIDYYIGGTIEVANGDQLVVSVGSEQITNYSYASGNLRIFGAPEAGKIITVTRRPSLGYTGDGSSDTYSTANIYTVNDIYSFRVLLNGELQRPEVDYIYTSGNEVVFTTAPAAADEINIISKSHYWTKVDTVTGTAGSRFGHSVSTTTDGRQFMVGTPRENNSGISDCGMVYVYDRSTERFEVNSAIQGASAVTTLRAPTAPTAVYLNNTLLDDQAFVLDGDYSISGSTITFYATLNIGDIIEVETNTIQLMQSIVANEQSANAEFGFAIDSCSNNCSLYVGAPYDNSYLPLAGSVERWGNQARLFGIITGTQTNPTVTVGQGIRINNYDVVFTGSSLDSVINDINNAGIDNVEASKTSTNQLVINLKNSSAGDLYEKLLVAPGSGTAFSNLGLAPYAYFQTLRSPVDDDYAYFGYTVNIDDSADNLVIGAPNGTSRLPLALDSDDTTFDGGSLTITDEIRNSGVVYTFDLLPSNNATVTNPSQMAFGQQIVVPELTALEKFGTSISYRSNRLIIGSPNVTNTESNVEYPNSGHFHQFTNDGGKLAWTIVRTQQPVANVRSINKAYIYDSRKNTVTDYLDYIDPLQGKVLGAVEQNLNYTTSIDPAAYNQGTTNNYGQSWRSEHVGEIWWNTTNARFIDYNQNDIEYAARRWGQLFPGSSIDVYQWVESDAPPASYTGPGQVGSTTRYNAVTVVNNQGLLATKYYFWVTGLVSIGKNKTLSLTSITQYLSDPISSGIPYMTVLDHSTVALYNSQTAINGNSVLNVEYDLLPNDDNVHVEYELIPENDPDGFLSDELFTKLIDSLSGADKLGKAVPDSLLPLADLYGISVRPRQSMFVDRTEALKNYIIRTNAECAVYPLRETRRFKILFSREPEPTALSGAWQMRVGNLTELGYQDLRLVPTGYKYLVASDSSNKDLWAIYERTADITLVLSRVQTYDTTQYWDYVNWYNSGFDPLTVFTEEVAVYADLATLTVLNNTVVKVTANSSGLWELYQLINGSWVRQALEKGTIKFTDKVYDYSIGRYGFDSEVFDIQYYDQYPSIETRQLLTAINEEIFVDDLASIRNQLLILMFEYIMTEQTAPDWLLKTSLIDVNHKIRDLIPYRVYKKDNQDFVEQYLNEVKPYHVKIKEFRLSYDALDINSINATDFDVPAYYDSSVGKFISPILDDGIPPIDPNSSRTSTNAIWTTYPWKQWYDNYLLEVQGITLVDGGTGYTTPPQITVTGNAERSAELQATINSAGIVTGIVIIDSGNKYTEPAVITITGGNGSGARAVAIMGNSLVRNIKTVLKYNRCEYTSNVVDWEANTYYDAGQLVRYNNTVYRAMGTLLTGTTLSTEDFERVPDDELTAADRVTGLYSPEPNQIGLDLALLIKGIDYPGVQVSGPLFSQNTGFDVGNFDINPFDNLDFGPEGRPTYNQSILDATYDSAFTDTYLGTRATDVNVEGGGFVDTYSSHAPEELVPGSMFDTLDMRVYTRPGADWIANGHGFAWRTVGYEYDPTNGTYSWAGIVKNPAKVFATNATTGKLLTPGPAADYQVNWLDRSITILGGIVSGQSLIIEVLGVGGGNQLYRGNFDGADAVSKKIGIPVQYDEIESMLVLINGEQDTGATIEQGVSNINETKVVLTNTPASTDFIMITAFGDSNPYYWNETTGDSTLDDDYPYYWSAPTSQEFIGDGSTLSFTLDAPLTYRNATNLFVFVDGQRLRPPESVERHYDFSTNEFFLPELGDTDHSIVANNEVKMFHNEIELIYGVDFFLSGPDSSHNRYTYLSTEYINDNTWLETGDKFIVSVTTSADFFVSDATLTLRNISAPVIDSNIVVVSFNDTRQQSILTQVFVGPTSLAELTVEPFDVVGYDAPNGFDFSEPITISQVKFDTGRQITDPRRVFVTLNGIRIFSDIDWYPEGSHVVLIGTVLDTDVITITSFTYSVVPDAMAFRIFVDMLGNRGLYRINDAGTTTLASALSLTDTTIYLSDATAVPEPDLSLNKIGVLTINGERITYLHRDLATNTVSGLRRGTAGTGIFAHDVNSTVYDLTAGQLLPIAYQDKTVAYKSIGDGSTTIYITDIDVAPINDSSILDWPVQVFVGGTLLDSDQYTVGDGSTDDGVQVVITLDEAPSAGEIVVVSIKQVFSLYGTQAGTALQEIDNSATRFLND
jgi:hypothetical protein